MNMKLANTVFLPDGKHLVGLNVEDVAIDGHLV